MHYRCHIARLSLTHSFGGAWEVRKSSSPGRRRSWILKDSDGPKLGLAIALLFILSQAAPQTALTLPQVRAPHSSSDKCYPA